MKMAVSQMETVGINTQTSIFFPEGIIGFSERKHYTIVEEKSKDPFFWLQAVDEPEPSFILIDPRQVDSDYKPSLSDADKEDLQIKDIEECEIFTIVVVPKNSNKITANFLAPLVINTKRNLAKQVILQEQDYSIQHLLWTES